MTQFNRIALLHWQPGVADGERDRLLDGLRHPAPGVQALLRPTLPGVFNGGDHLWKLRGANRGAIDAAAQALSEARLPLAHVDDVFYEDGAGGGAWEGRGVYRALLLAVRREADPEAVLRFEREVLAMPRYIDAIRAWRLSRVQHATGSRAWTHVWEQRYDGLDGLAGPYMTHPYHWAHVDRWFDPESPDWIVDTRLCHSFCSLD
jgi:hypothetical protein